MSMTSAAGSYRRDDHKAMRVPVVMPLVEVTVDRTGHLTVLLDREPYSADGALQRKDLQRVLDDIAADLSTPVRVEVHEANGSRFTDIVTPGHRRPHAVEPAKRTSATVGEVAGEGFWPNEDVAVAVVVAHQTASTAGTTRLRLPPALLEAHPGLLVLLGKKSGTVMVFGGAA